MKLNTNQGGFTLLELVVVLAVISILTAALIYGIPKWQEQSRLAVAVEMGRSMQQGTIAYCAQNSGNATTVAGTNTKIPPFVQKNAVLWDNLLITGTSAPVTPTFAAATCGSSPDSALLSVKWSGGCAIATENIVYTTATNTATCQ